MKYFLKLQFIFLSLILLIVHTSENAYAQTPPVGAIQVTPEEFKELKKEEIKPVEVEPEPVQDNEAALNFPSAFIQGGVNGSGGDGAILIFAIVGVVMVVAWIPYAVFLAYRAFNNPKLYRWNTFVSLQVMPINQDSNKVQHREGIMSSLRVTPYSSRINSPKILYGLNFELGYFNFHDQLQNTNHKQYYHSPYWQMGPSMFFDNGHRMIPINVRLDFTAGTSFHQDVDLLLRSELTLSYIWQNGLYLGAGIAALYLYGREGKGIMNHIGDLTIQPVLTTGMAF